jgi:hypothetical protein
MLNLKPYKQWIIAFSCATVGFIIFGQGCGMGFAPANGVSSLSSGLQCQAKANDSIIDKTYTVDPNKRTVSIAYGEELLNSYVACTGIGQASQRTKDEWTRRNQSLSEYGSLTDLSGAMMMGIAAVASEICEDVYERESALPAANRNLFTAANLGGTGLSSSEIGSAVDMIGLACWQRQPSSDEKTDLANTIMAANLNSKMGAVALCTAMLASYSAIEQ